MPLQKKSTEVRNMIGCKKLVVSIASLEMPRSLAELRRAFPQRAGFAIGHHVQRSTLSVSVIRFPKVPLPRPFFLGLFDLLPEAGLVAVLPFYCRREHQVVGGLLSIGQGYPGSFLSSILLLLALFNSLYRHGSSRGQRQRNSSGAAAKANLEMVLLNAVICRGNGNRDSSVQAILLQRGRWDHVPPGCKHQCPRKI